MFLKGVCEGYVSETLAETLIYTLKLLYFINYNEGFNNCETIFVIQ